MQEALHAVMSKSTIMHVVSGKCVVTSHFCALLASSHSWGRPELTLRPKPDPEQEFFRNMLLYSAAALSFWGGEPCFPFAKSLRLEHHQVSLKSLLPSNSWLFSCKNELKFSSHPAAKQAWKGSTFSLKWRQPEVSVSLLCSKWSFSELT